MQNVSSAALRRRRHRLIRGLPPIEQIVRGSLIDVPIPTLAESEALPYPALTFTETGRERRIAIEPSGSEKTVSIATCLPTLAESEALPYPALTFSETGRERR